MKVVKVTESASGQTVFLLKRSGRERRVDLAWAVAAGFGGVASLLFFVYGLPPHGWPPSGELWGGAQKQVRRDGRRWLSGVGWRRQSTLGWASVVCVGPISAPPWAPKTQCHVEETGPMS